MYWTSSILRYRFGSATAIALARLVALPPDLIGGLIRSTEPTAPAARHTDQTPPPESTSPQIQKFRKILDCFYRGLRM
jgi:hypothetical protein